MMDENNELFYEDAYRTSFEATVTACEKDGKGYAVLLDRTAFYPEGGGQPYDTGFLDDVRVREVHRRNGAIVHYTDGALAVGKTVTGRIDFERRFDLMQQHSGEHVFSGLVHRFFGYDNIGFHLGEKEVVLDFSGPLDPGQVRMIEEKTNAMIQKNIAVEAFYPSEEELAELEYRSKKELEGKVRIVRIQDCDVCACCGTHVKNIGEVGYAKVISLMNKRGNARIGVLFGRRATEYMAKIYDQTSEVSALLSKSPLEIAQGVRHLQKEATDKTVALNLLYTRQFQRLLQEAEPCDLYITVEEGCSMDLLRHFCDAMTAKARVCAGLLKKGEEDYQYVILSASADLKECSKLLNERFAGKGGGSKQMIQGSLHGSDTEIKVFLHELFC
ncbi:MAG: alanyl-tRNA editing protein [Erysipelotrichaceae bacterium]|nr:alanyl-tRNA editing protein [Erysipelotrichaceae bacterium]